MVLHIGDNRIVERAEIVAILPAGLDETRRSAILLADGQTVYSSLATATLKKRLDAHFTSLLEPLDSL